MYHANQGYHAYIHISSTRGNQSMYYMPQSKISIIHIYILIYLVLKEPIYVCSCGMHLPLFFTFPSLDEYPMPFPLLTLWVRVLRVCSLNRHSIHPTYVVSRSPLLHTVSLSKRTNYRIIVIHYTLLSLPLARVDVSHSFCPRKEL